MSSFMLPREVASAAIVRGLATAQRAIVIVGVVLTIAPIAVVGADRGADPVALATAMASILTLAAVTVPLLLRPSRVTATLFLVVGSVAAGAYTASLLMSGADFDEPGPFLLNRASTALVMVGAVGSRIRDGLLWTAFGVIASQSSLQIGSALAGFGWHTGVTPLFAAGLTLCAYAGLGLAGLASRRRSPDFDLLRRSVESADRQRALHKKAARVIHDTVLADLAMVSMTTGALSEEVTERIRSDVDRASSSVLTRDEPLVPANRSEIATDLLDLVEGFRWSGVMFDVSGCEALEARVSERCREAIVGATRAALDNVVRHAQTDRAEIVVGDRGGVLSVLVVDSGVGFDAESLTDDRLGVRSSIHSRVIEVGGSARVWSGSEGTTVMLTVPVEGEAP